MKSKLCERLGIEFPLFAFSHCRDVVAAVSRAGGMGVLGAVNHTPEELREELAWIDAHCGGKPYGVDLIVPTSMAAGGAEMDPDALLAALPAPQREFVDGLLAEKGISADDLDEDRRSSLRFARNMGAAARPRCWTSRSPSR